MVTEQSHKINTWTENVNNYLTVSELFLNYPVTITYYVVIPVYS